MKNSRPKAIIAFNYLTYYFKIPHALYCLPLLPRVVPLLPPLSPTSPPQVAELSCCAACVFDLVFHWLSSCQGQGLRLGHEQSHTVWLGVIQLLWPCAALNHSLSGGVTLWFLAAPYLTQWGSKLIRSPAQSLPSGVRIFWFTLANCTSSAVSKQEHNLFWEYISSTADAECSVPEPYVPRYFSFYLKVGKRNRDKRSLIVCMNSCMRMLLGKPNRNQMCSPHSTCGGLLVLIYISVNLRPHISLPLHPCDVPWQLTSQLFLLVFWKLRG